MFPMSWPTEDREERLLGEGMPVPVRLPAPRVVPLLSHPSFLGPCDKFIRRTSTRMDDFLVESQFLTGVMRSPEELGAPPGWPGTLPRVLFPFRKELVGIVRKAEVGLRRSEAILTTCIFIKSQVWRVTEEHG